MRSVFGREAWLQEGPNSKESLAWDRLGSTTRLLHKKVAMARLWLLHIYIYTHTYTHTYNQASIEITVRLPGQVQISGGRDVEASAKVEVAGRKVRF